MYWGQVNKGLVVRTEFESKMRLMSEGWAHGCGKQGFEVPICSSLG